MNDEKEWQMAIDEAALEDSPVMVRNLFCYIVVHCAPKNPKELWENNKVR